MKNIASRILALFLLLGCFLIMTQDAVADTVYQTSGDGKTTVTFYVKSNGKSSITLKQTKGIHQGMGFLGIIGEAVLGTDDQWGQYHIDIYTPSGSSYSDDWADYFFGSTHKLSFSSEGVYKVVVRPFSQSEMDDAHPLYLQWGNWNKQPQWWVDSCSNCSVATSNNVPVSPVTATVTIRCIDSSTNGMLRNTQEKVSEGDTALYAPSISGYTAVWPSMQKVTLLRDGTVNPSIVIFKYIKDSSVGNSNNNVTARVTVEGVNAVTNEVLYREYKDLKPGNTTIAARNLSDAYYFSGASSENVYVSQDGTASQSVVRFYYTPKTTTGNGGSTGAGSYVTTPPVTPQPPHHGNDLYNIGVPNLNGKVYYENDMNVHVLWVHYQLKATGQYYQGDNWDETGNLGNTTMKEIAKFMKANGYPNHNGRVDQTVINTFANYLGNRVVPVYAGGYYDKMNTIMSGGSAGSMQSIDEYSSSTKIKWVQTCLKKLGYYSSSIDGKFGSGTINALKRFQSDYGYVQRDYVSLGVARAMLEACYNRGCSLDDLP